MQTSAAKSWLIGLVSVTSLGLGIWFAGDSIRIGGESPLTSPERRAEVIAGLVIAWVLIQSIGLFLAGRQGQSTAIRRKTAQLDPLGHISTKSAYEIALLQEHFLRNSRLLKSRRARRHLRRKVANLPCYLVIGPPDSGKTAMLANSGLHFPLHDSLASDLGLGCDWWVSEDAMLIDTAGRYTIQGSHQQADRTSWQTLLHLLKAYRPPQPINGVLVAISIRDLLQQSATGRDELIKVIAQRLGELTDAFQIQIPVYLIITKFDLLAGFADLFGDLGDKQLNQVCGFSLSDEMAIGAEPTECLRHGLSDLLDRLSQRALARLEAESDPVKATSALAFPQQVATLRAPLTALISRLGGAEPEPSKRLLRGLYFSSATQVGTPIDRVLLNVAASCGFFGSPPRPHQGSARPYFLTSVFRDVIFPEACLAGNNRQAMPGRFRRPSLKAFAWVLLIGMVAAGGLLAHQRNLARMQATQQAAEDLQRELAGLNPEQRDPVALLPLLDQARALSNASALPHWSADTLSRLGLTAQTAIRQESTALYRRVLRTTLLPLVLLRLEDQIRDSAGDWQQLLDTLRIYLQLSDAAHYDGDMVRYWVGRDWERGLLQGKADEQQLEALKDHLQVLLEAPPAPLQSSMDDGLISDARRILTRKPLAKRLYEQLKSEGLGPDFAEISLNEAAGDFARLVFDRRSGRSLNEGVPALYTYDGYHRGVEAKLRELAAAATGDAWVLGLGPEFDADSSAALRLMGEVRQLYLRDYVASWDALLQDVDIIPPRDLRHAAEIARMLADREQSPLRRLLLTTMAQTGLDRSDEPDQTEPDPSRQSTNPGFRERVDRYFDEPQTGDSGGLSIEPGAYVSRRFRWLPELLRPQQGETATFERAQAALERASLLLESMAAAASTGRGALAAGEAPEISDLREAAKGLPAPVAAMLITLSQDSAEIVSSNKHAELNRLWTSKILPFCRRSINDRYPFDRAASREVSLRDFGYFLGPDGLLETFFRDHLSAVVDTADRPWKWKESDGAFSEETLEQFQQANAIREAFFSEKSPLPTFSQEFTPIAVDQQTREASIQLGGQVLLYRESSNEPRLFVWPSKLGEGQAGIEFVDRRGMRPSLSFTGPWAWFHLLDTARLSQDGDDASRYRATFSLDGHEAEFEVRAMSKHNPLLGEGLRGFRCVDRL